MIFGRAISVRQLVDSSWILMAVAFMLKGEMADPAKPFFADEIEFDKNKVDSVARQFSGLLSWVL
jgi:hypothetical protein